MSDPDLDRWLHDTMASQARTRALPVACAACGEPEIHPAMPCPTCGRKPATARIGTTLGGRYRIDSLLGQGGFGLVYRATHVLLDQPVAVKFLLAEWAKSTELRTRFQREATALARLRHPGIVAVHDFGEEEGDLYIVMELVEGQPLSKHILRDGQLLPPDRIVRILGHVCEVLEAAHAAGIVHRDLKPENVMVAEGADDRVKILDFGLALVQEPGGKRLTKTNAVQGTPIYMSPEQCRGRDVGTPTDVYALGVMLFELLAGVPPFMAEGPMEVMAQHMFVEPPRVKEVGLKREPHPGLEALARAALAKKVEERPTAAEFHARLDAALAGEDDASLLAASVAARLSHAVLSREERALPPRVPTTPPSAPLPDGPAERVALFGFPSARVEALRAALSVNGLLVTAWAEDELGGPDAAEVKAVIVPGDGAESRIPSLRAHPATARRPIVVVDVKAVSSTPLLIRAGAADVSLAQASDEAIAQRVLKLLRGRRRAP